MKIVFDTDKIKSGFSYLNEKVFSLREYSDREVFFLCVFIIMFGYIISDYLDTKKFFYINNRIGSVEVSLERIQNRLDMDVIENSEDRIENDVIYSAPKTEHPKLFNTRKKVSLSQKEFDCLARNIYWESMREPLLGQMAVANVTHNRVKSGKWGNTFCSVVFAPKQFSWTNFRKIRNAVPRNEKHWMRARHSAFLFTRGVRVTNLEGSQFYYADYIRAPKWSHGMNRIAQIGTHIFFEDRGDMVGDTLVSQGDVE